MIRFLQILIPTLSLKCSSKISVGQYWPQNPWKASEYKCDDISEKVL